MKNIFFFFILLIPCSLFSQKQTVYNPIPDVRLYEVYDSSYIKNLLDKNPFIIERWNFYLDHSWEIAEFSDEKGVSYPFVTIPDFENINILLLEKELGLQRNYKLPQVFRIANTNKVLVYLSGDKCNKSFNTFLKEKTAPSPSTQ